MVEKDGKEQARTEDEKVSQAPVVVTFAGTEYQIPLLVIRDSREWRKKVIALIAPLPTLVNLTAEDPESFGNALTSLLVTMPDQVLDLFFDYAKDLDREAIEAVATDAEMAKAFEEVVKVTFPLAESLPKALTRLSQ